AERDPLAAGANNCRQEGVAISGLLDGTGDYEGDRVLVGDVPWGCVFRSTLHFQRVVNKVTTFIGY
ncbi:Os06g0314300, partial [Oryza sativa Japonica Group]